MARAKETRINKTHRIFNTFLVAVLSVLLALSATIACLPTQQAEAATYDFGTLQRNANSNSYSFKYSNIYGSRGTSSTDSQIIAKTPSNELWSTARNRIGTHGAIVGKVYSVSYRPDVNGSPTFINIGADYPSKSRVQVVIWGSDRRNFSSAPERVYKGQWIRVTGDIQLYNGVPEIIARKQSQIELVK